MRPYAPAPLSASAVTAASLAAYVLTELKKLGEVTRVGERERIGSVTLRAPAVSAYRVLPSDALVRVDALFAPVTVVLPLASLVVGNRVTVKRLNSAGSDVTVETSGADLIDGAPSVTLAAPAESITVVAVRDGTTFTWDITGTT